MAVALVILQELVHKGMPFQQALREAEEILLKRLKKI